MSCPCCGRVEACSDRSAVGVCDDCEMRIKFSRWRDKQAGPEVFNKPVTDLDVASMMAKQLTRMARRSEKSKPVQLCKAMNGNWQCRMFATTERDGHPVCTAHHKSKTQRRFVGDRPVGAPMEVKLIVDLLMRDPQLRAAAAAAGVVYVEPS